MKKIAIRSFNHLSCTLLLGGLALACSSGDGAPAPAGANEAESENGADEPQDDSVEEKAEDEDAMAVEGEGGATAVESESPGIVKTSPGAGETGVLRDAVIEIEFDVPMDTASVEAAYSSDTLASEFVSFEWNDDGTLLYITPNEDLQFAIGDDPETLAALEYDYSVNTSAKSAEGEKLDEALEVKFTTVRGVVTKISGTGSLSGSVKSSNEPFSTIWVGDSGQNVSAQDETNAHYIGLLHFDLSSLGDDVIAFDKVILSADQVVENGTPYVSLILPLAKFQGLELFDVEYSTRSWEQVNAGWSDQIGLLSGTASSSVSLDVSDAVSKDYDAGRAAQFALRFSKITNADDMPDNVLLTEPSLEVLYYLP